MSRLWWHGTELGSRSIYPGDRSLSLMKSMFIGLWAKSMTHIWTKQDHRRLVHTQSANDHSSQACRGDDSVPRQYRETVIRVVLAIDKKKSLVATGNPPLWPDQLTSTTKVSLLMLCCCALPSHGFSATVKPVSIRKANPEMPSGDRHGGTKARKGGQAESPKKTWQSSRWESQ